MGRRWSSAVGGVGLAGGAIGVAVWAWTKRGQLALAAAKALPGRASRAATEQASATATGLTEQASDTATGLAGQATTTATGVTEQVVETPTVLPEQPPGEAPPSVP